jgi:hypothetical protein
MYFDLPKNKKENNNAEERISEILNNIEDHWGSPPILTPDTLAYILNHQWSHSNEDNNKSKYQLLLLEFIK